MEKTVPQVRKEICIFCTLPKASPKPLAPAPKGRFLHRGIFPSAEVLGKYLSKIEKAARQSVKAFIQKEKALYQNEKAARQSVKAFIQKEKAIYQNVKAVRQSVKASFKSVKAVSKTEKASCKKQKAIYPSAKAAGQGEESPGGE